MGWFRPVMDVTTMSIAVWVAVFVTASVEECDAAHVTAGDIVYRSA